MRCLPLLLALALGAGSDDALSMKMPKYGIVFTNTTHRPMIVHGIGLRVKQCWKFRPSAMGAQAFLPSAIVPVTLYADSEMPYGLRCSVTPILQVGPGQQAYIQIHYQSVGYEYATAYIIETFIHYNNNGVVSLGDSLVFIPNAVAGYSVRRPLNQQKKVMPEPAISEEMKKLTESNQKMAREILRFDNLLKSNPVLNSFVRSIVDEPSSQPP